jgi:DNA-binding response OmpR family regulator
VPVQENVSLEWEQQPDGVIIDPTRKNMDGLAVYRAMRTKHDVPVLVMTDSRDVRNEVRCLESGTDDYSRKPFFPAQFLVCLHTMERRGRSVLLSNITAGLRRV